MFALDPIAQTFTCIFASPGAATLDNPDNGACSSLLGQLRLAGRSPPRLASAWNTAVSPRGGLVLCEGGANEVQALQRLTPDGEIFRFAENRVVLNGQRNGVEGNFTAFQWAGATFEPKDGNWLFVNIQTPGITFAITGPWRHGAL